MAKMRQTLVVVTLVLVAAAGACDEEDEGALGKFASEGGSLSKSLERGSVQAALEYLKLAAGITVVAAHNKPSDTAINTWADQPTRGGKAIIVDGEPVGLSDFMKLKGDTTSYYYCWDSAGLMVAHKLEVACQ